MARSPKTVRIILSAVWLVVAGGCGTEGPGSSVAEGSGTGGAGMGGAGTATGGPGWGGGCAVAVTLENVSVPVDVVLVVDNSVTMSEEIAEVEEQLNENFAAVIGRSALPIDYRVILISAYGPSTSQRMCVAAPLGGIADADMDGHCDTVPAQPVNTTTFFHHSALVTGHNSLCRFVREYSTVDEFGIQPNGYGDLLRPEAIKFLMVVSNDRPSTADPDTCLSPLYDDLNTIAGGDAVAQQLRADLVALAPLQFGPEGFNFVFWTIAGMAPFSPTSASPYGELYPWFEPNSLTECTPGALNPGTGYQAASIMTGSPRYPTCGLDYSNMFASLADSVTASGSRLSCEFLIPVDPSGEDAGTGTLALGFPNGAPAGSTGSGTPDEYIFSEVQSVGECNDTSFYTESNKIVLCPGACQRMQDASVVAFDVLFDCTLK